MNDKQQQLTFDRGITNVPSDALCSDNELQESTGMYYADGEHRPVQKPREFMRTDGFTVLCVHKLADVTNYIGIDKDGNLKAGYKGSDNTFVAYDKPLLENVSSDTLQVTSIGKTLIVNTADGIKYFLWKADEDNYDDLGTIPEPRIEFYLKIPTTTYVRTGTDGSKTENHIPRNSVYTIASVDSSWFSFFNYDRGDIKVVKSKQEDYNNAVVGAYEQALKKIAEKKGFAKPFKLRFAVELFDGSYILASAPIMLFPAITKDCIAYSLGNAWRVHVLYSGLSVKGKFDYSAWQDIVKGVSVFVTEGVSLYDTSVDQEPSFVEEGFSYHDYIGTNKTGGSMVYSERTGDLESDPSETLYRIDPMTRRDKESILNDLKNASIFYKISEMGNAFNGDQNLDIGDHIIDNLTSQERLSDDYYSHCDKSAKFITAYNNRLLLANVRRGFFKGFTSFMPYSVSNNTEYAARSFKIKVWIRKNEETRIVSKEFATDEIMGTYFFYPDPMAYKAQIFMWHRKTSPSGYYLLKEMELKEHPFLNGAYYFERLPDGTEEMTTQGAAYVDEDATTPENLYNQILNSEVNNPFVFNAIRSVTVGTGNILSVTTLTQALSQGQFGQYPIIVFTDEGIYAASVDGTGVIAATHPMSREVLNNTKSVTQTDGAVFFSSEKGLMVVVGNEVRCVSEQLSGKSDNPFQAYLRKAFIAYDYRDSLLWIFNGSSVCWLYSMKSGTFSRYDFGEDLVVKNVVNKYPDFLLQSGSEVLSLLGRENINEDETLYNGRIITRPMKLENALALKSIMQLKNIKSFAHDHISYYAGTDKDGKKITAQENSLELSIDASNDLRNWTTLHSLRGIPWKYYRFSYVFKNLKATDRFAGTVIITQERRINKMR